MLSIRNKPKNLKTEDLWIFQHELERNFPDPSVIPLRNLLITGELAFPGKYKSHRALSYHSSFVSFAINKLVRKIGQSKFAVFPKKYLLITDDWSKSYFHWLMDCLPRLILFKDRGVDLTLLLPSYLREKPFVQESLAMLRNSNYRFLEKDSWYYVRGLFFPVHLAPTGNYNDEVTKKLRSAFAGNTAEAPVLKIYISRSKAAHRKIANENEIQPLLERHGFKTVYCEEISFKEQVSLFNNTAILLANHGAGLTNMLFMQAGTTVIELRKSNDSHNNCYFSLASALDINYYYLQCEPVNATEDAYTGIFLSILLTSGK